MVRYAAVTTTYDRSVLNWDLGFGMWGFGLTNIQPASAMTGRNMTELSCVSSASANAATESVGNRDWPSSRHLRNQSRLRHPNNAPIASASAPTQAMAS